MRRGFLTIRPRRRAVRIGAAWLACLPALALALCPGMASALTIDSFETSRALPDGTPATQAGAHPDFLTASFALGESGEPEAAKSIRLGLPRGFFISPDAVPKCTIANFGTFECPSSTQVGLITLRGEYEGDPSHLLGTAPVYALVPAIGEIAHLGFIAPLVNLPVEVPVTVRSSSDYGVDLTLQSLPQTAALAAAELTLWGVPADPQHDAQRFVPGSPSAPAGCPEAADTSCIGGLVNTGGPLIPLLHNPTACGGPLSSTLDLTTYQHPGDVLSATFADLAGTSGCAKNGFSPMSRIALTTAQTRSPSGLSLELNVNDGGFYSPIGIAQSQIKSASVALPAGLEIDSTTAGALGTCTDAQFGAGSATPSSCPLDSEVGTFSIAVAGLSDPLDGIAYFGPAEPGGGHRLFLTASGPSFAAKLIGLLQPGSAGGPVTVSLANLPQLPLEELGLELADPNLLVTPVKCGTYMAKVTYTPWSSSSAPALLSANDISLTSTGPDEGPCPGPATDVDVALSPPSILADGSSTSLATATVTDAGEIPVPGDQIAFTSTDPGQQIGAVTDNEDGTYSARITSSTAVGAQTIKATDATVGPGIFGTATLTQIALEVPRPAPIVLPPPALTAPLVTIIRRPPRQTHDRTPSFRFTSTVAGSKFSCKVDGQRFKPCTSPKTLAKLDFDSHTFSVRATDPAGTASAPAICRFTVRRAPAS